MCWLAVTIDGVQKTRPRPMGYCNASGLTQSQRGSHGASRAGPGDERVEGRVGGIGKDLEDISLIISCRYYGMLGKADGWMAPKLVKKKKQRDEKGNP